MEETLPNLHIPVTMTVPTVVHKSDFGYLTGLITEEGPVQFRNVPYSKPTPRWQHSTPLDHLENDAEHPHDATQWGPIAPQDSTSIDFDFGLIQKDLPHDRTFRVSETECLNLVVTTPSMEAKNLPVMVWYVIDCLLARQWPFFSLPRWLTLGGFPLAQDSWASHQDSYCAHGLGLTLDDQRGFLRRLQCMATIW